MGRVLNAPKWLIPLSAILRRYFTWIKSYQICRMALSTKGSNPARRPVIADTRMFFQLVSQRLRLSDSSLELMGSTSGALRCRRKKPIGLVYRAQMSAIVVYSVSSPVIVVLALHLSVLALNVIKTDWSSPRKAIYLKLSSFLRCCVGILVYRICSANFLP